MDFSLISNFLIQNDPAVQKEVLNYFESLKNDDLGWKLCVETLLNSREELNESGLFFCLQVTENYIKTRYASDSEENQSVLRQFLFSWFISIPSSSNYILNKFAYIVNSVFLIDFPKQSWTSFFADFLLSCQTQQHADLFLRILLQINSDVADREIPRSPKELERNTVIKDAMRENCLIDLAQFWFNVICSYRENSPSTVCLCLEVIGAFVSWIDISLITNASIMPSLFNLFTEEPFRCCVTDCFNGVLHKGMDPLAKAQLIEQFISVETIKEKFSEIGTKLSTDLPENELIFITKFAKLINTIGVELIEAFKKLKSKLNTESQSYEIDLQTINFVSSSIESKFIILCQILSSKDHRISLQVHQFAREYIQWIKHNSKAANAECSVSVIDEKLILLLKILIDKCKYPLSYDFDNECENNFDEYRKTCKILFDNLLLLNASAVIHSVCTHLIEPVLLNWRAHNYSFSEVEVALYFFYLIGENFNLITDQKKIENLLQLLISSSVSSFQHWTVQAIYFDIVLRYEKFFGNTLSYLSPQILVSFLDERGFKNSNSKVRSKVSHSFNRFVKSQIKSKASDRQQSFTEDILKRLQDYLKLDAVQTTNNGYLLNNFRKENIFQDVHYFISTEDQLCIYETVAVLIISNQNFNINKKQTLLKSMLIQPIWETYKDKCTSLMNLISSNQLADLNKFERDEHMKKIKTICEELGHFISLVARTSKAFSNIQTIKSLNAQSIYLESFELFVKSLSMPLPEELLNLIQSSIRQLLHRIIVCLDETDIVPLLPNAIQNLFLSSQLNGRTIQELVPLLNQIVTKFKHSWLFQRDLCPFMKRIFLPLISSFFCLILQPSIGPDETYCLQKSYYIFLSILTSNNIMDMFADLEFTDLERILRTLVQGCLEFPDAPTQKNCFQILRKLIQFYDISNQEACDSPKRLELIPAFNDFLYNSILPVCFSAPLRNPDDSQLLIETICCLKDIQKTRGTENFRVFLQTHFFSQHFASENCTPLIEAILGDDFKTTRNLFKQFGQKLKKEIV